MTELNIETAGQTPRYAHPNDAGADLIASHDTWITPSSFRRIQTGTKVAIPDGHFGLVAGRSGLGINHGIALVNGIGVIDAGYRGEIAVGLVNHGAAPYQVRAGDRIAQLIIVPFATVNYHPVAQLDDTQRGTGGFGSTGVAVVPNLAVGA